MKEKEKLFLRLCVLQASIQAISEKENVNYRRKRATKFKNLLFFVIVFSKRTREALLLD
jgi:hypothetical protein